MGKGLYPNWTEEDLETLKELYPDHSDEEIGKILGRTPGSVKLRAVRRGLRKSLEYVYRSRTRPRPRRQIGCIPNPLPVIERLLIKHKIHDRDKQ